MKFSLIFLSLFVASSQQHYWRHYARHMGYHWLPPFVQYQPDDLTDNYQGSDDKDVTSYHLLLVKPVTIIVQKEREKPDIQASLDNRYDSESSNYGDIQPRIKSYGQSEEDPIEQSSAAPRLFFNVVTTSIRNPLLKTVTLTITSTCTALTFVTCVPRANVLPVAPAAVYSCGRKRHVDRYPSEDEDDLEDQFSALPSGIQQVRSTEQPYFLDGEERVRELEIASSMESDTLSELRIKRRAPQKGRFYYFWQSFATATTITSWVVIPSVSTRTLIPNVNGVATTFPCLPSGYVICTATG